MPGSLTEDPSVQLEIAYLEASRRVSSNLYNHLAWMITDASPELGEHGRLKVTPKQQEQVLNLAQDVCQAVAKIPTPKHIGTALQCGLQCFVVVATDTDVIMMCMYYITHMDGLQEMWVKTMDVFLPVHAITEALVGKYDVLASDLTSLLLSTYILTGI